MPVVSVLLPVLNGAPFLAESIQSILGQNMSDLELIVVDDGSEDGSQEIAAELARNDRRIRCVCLARDPRTESGARASNVGLELATGAYIARMDADDISTPDRLEVQLGWINDRGLDVCGGQTRRFGEMEGEIWYPETQAAMAFELVFRSGLANGAMLARADVLKAARFSETEAYEEYELQTRLISKARLGNGSEVVLGLRTHPGQTTRVLGLRKAESRMRLRFQHFFRLFPGARLRDFRLLNSVARATPLADCGDLEAAGDWLVRLSRPPEEKLRRRMARRWTDACARYRAAGRDPGAQEAHYRQLILAPPV
jgi:glycosyltransferase involved in cell wall biosynthesis